MSDSAADRRVVCDAAGCLEAVEVRHLDVHEYYVGLQPLHCEDGFVAVARLADDSEIVFGSRGSVRIRLGRVLGRRRERP